MIVVYPGDTLIICCSYHLTADQAAEIQRVVLDRLTGIADVIILPATQVATYRPN